MSEDKDKLFEELTDQAAGYYLGLWNLLQKEGAPQAVIINAAINNLVAIFETYMSYEQQINMLDIMKKKIKEEHSLASERMN